VTDRLVCDTARMVALTARRPETIRHVCRDLKGPGGYDYETCKERLDEHPDEVVVVALTPLEAERYLGIRANTVTQWAFRGRLTEYDKVGNRPRYRVEDLQRLRHRDARKAQLDL
jgi:hypothetical protein